MFQTLNLEYLNDQYKIIKIEVMLMLNHFYLIQIEYFHHMLMYHLMFELNFLNKKKTFFSFKINK